MGPVRSSGRAVLAAASLLVKSLRTAGRVLTDSLQVVLGVVRAVRACVHDCRCVFGGVRVRGAAPDASGARMHNVPRRRRASTCAAVTRLVLHAIRVE